MNKEKEIKKYLAEPIKVGETVETQGLNSRNPLSWNWCEVVSIKGNKLTLKTSEINSSFERDISEVRKVTFFIGANPFKKTIRTTGYQVDIEQALWRAGYAYNCNTTDSFFLTKRMEVMGKQKILAPEICDNPMVIDKKGKEVEFQRGLVWTLEQKQLLIESIWNNIEIGKIVLRLRSFEWVEKRINEGKLEHTAFMDLIDGKQRINALVSYINGEFADLNGLYWKDLSTQCQGQFLGYRNISYVELDEKTTDAETLETFLAINFTGVPMSKEHLKFVQSINIK